MAILEDRHVSIVSFACVNGDESSPSRNKSESVLRYLACGSLWRGAEEVEGQSLLLGSVESSSSMTMAWCVRPVDRVGVRQPQFLSWSQFFCLTSSDCHCQMPWIRAFPTTDCTGLCTNLICGFRRLLIGVCLSELVTRGPFLGRSMRA